MFCIFPIKWNNQLYFAAVSARFKSVSEELTELLRSNFRSATDINPTWTSDGQLSNYQYVCVDKGSSFLKCVGSIYVGIAQIALNPPPCQRGKRGQKVVQTILESRHTHGQTWEKSAPNHPGKPLPPRPPTFGQCPYGNNTFKKGVSL